MRTKQQTSRRPHRQSRIRLTQDIYMSDREQSIEVQQGIELRIDKSET